MTHVECLSIGDYIALVECYRDRYSMQPFGPLWLEVEDVTFDGLPLRVCAISLPFICVEHQGKRFSVDVRDWGFQKLNAKYAREMLASGTGQTQTSKKKKPDRDHCPHCGTRLRQRLTQGQHAFRIICPECQWDGGEIQTDGVSV